MRPQQCPQSGLGVEPEWHYDLLSGLVWDSDSTTPCIWAGHSVPLSLTPSSKYVYLRAVGRLRGEVYEKFLQRNPAVPGQTLDYPGQT